MIVDVGEILLYKLPHNEGQFLLLPGRCQSAIFICFVDKFVLGSQLAGLHFYLLGWEFLACAHVFDFSSYIFRVQNESPTCVFNADMFATPSPTFKLPSYAIELAHLLAEAPSPPSSCTCPFNNLVLDFLDIEAEQGEDSDRYGSPSS